MAEYIERELLLKNIKHNIPYVYHMLASLIRCIPSDDVAPVVHARWEKTWDLIDGHDGYKCRACGYTKYFDHYSEGITLCKPYCCNCGARMDGEEHATD